MQTVLSFQSLCKEDKYCLPITPNKTNVAKKLKNKSLVVLVRPFKANSWLEVDPSLDTSKGITIKDQKVDSVRVCEVGLDVDECAENEICKPSGPRSRSGICSCKDGFVKDEKKNCIHKGIDGILKCPH